MFPFYSFQIKALRWYILFSSGIFIKFSFYLCSNVFFLPFRAAFRFTNPDDLSLQLLQISDGLLYFGGTEKITIYFARDAEFSIRLPTLPNLKLRYITSQGLFVMGQACGRWTPSEGTGDSWEPSGGVTGPVCSWLPAGELTLSLRLPGHIVGTLVRYVTPVEYDVCVNTGRQPPLQIVRIMKRIRKAKFRNTNRYFP